MTIEEIRKQVFEDARQQYSDPTDRLQSNGDKALKYAEYRYRISKERDKQKRLLDHKYAELYKANKFESNRILKNKQDVECFIDTDEEYQKLRAAFDTLESILIFLDQVVQVYQHREASERLIFKSKTGIGDR
jgi:hypothetical protein